MGLKTLTALIFSIGFMYSISSCGPSARESENKRIEDSIRVADSFARLQAKQDANTNYFLNQMFIYKSGIVTQFKGWHRIVGLDTITAGYLIDMKMDDTIVHFHPVDGADRKVKDMNIKKGDSIFIDIY